MTRFRPLFAALVFRPAHRDGLRFALTVAGIAIGVATVAAIQLANASVLSSFSRSVDVIAGKATLTVLSDGPGIPEETLNRISWLRRAGVAFAPAVSEMAAFGGPEGEAVEVFGFDPMSEASVRDYALEPGGQDGPDLAPGDGSIATLFSIFEKDSLLLTSTLARRLGVKRGDAVTLVTQGQSREFRVVAVVKPSGPARSASGAIVFADIATVQEAFGKEPAGSR